MESTPPRRHLVELTDAQSAMVRGAWERGAEVGVDVFGDSWDLFGAAAEPLAAVRAAYGVRTLDPAYAAHGETPSWYHPVA